MTSVRTDIGGFVTARLAHWVVDDRASIAPILAAIAVCIGALSGCTNTPAQEGSRTTPSSSPQNAQAQLLALEGTVGYLHQWSQHHLVQEVRGLTDRSGPIPSEARLRALRKAIAGAVAVHLGCESVDAKLIEPVSTTIEIRATRCIYPVSATGTETLAVAQGCVILAAPTGTVDAFINQAAQDPFGPPPILVDSRAKAEGGTWYLGPCL